MRYLILPRWVIEEGISSEVIAEIDGKLFSQGCEVLYADEQPNLPSTPKVVTQTYRDIEHKHNKRRNR